MEKVKWQCPRCQKNYRIPEGAVVTLCPACQSSTGQSPPPEKPRRKNAPLIAGVGVAIMIPLCCGLWYFLISSGKLAAIGDLIPKEDIGKAPIRKWLKENLNDGSWEEVKWWPTIEPQSLFNANARRLISQIEEEKDRFESGKPMPHDALATCKQHWEAFKAVGVRKFCAVKYRTPSPLGGGKIIHTTSFEIVDGDAVPLKGDLIVEYSMLNIKHITHDVWKFLDNPEYDPSPSVPPVDIAKKLQAATIWQEPPKKAPKQEIREVQNPESPRPIQKSRPQRMPVPNQRLPPIRK